MVDEEDLESLPGVGSKTAQSLRDAGYTRIRDVASANPGELSDETSLGDSKAGDVVQAAREEADIGGFEAATNIKERRQKIGKLELLVSEIDGILGGGFETQSISEVYGEFGAGKSQITHQLAVNVQLQEEHGGLHGSAVFIDTEDTFRPERIDDMVRGLPEDVLESEFEHRGLDEDYDLDNEEGMDELVDHFLEYITVAEAYDTSHQMILVDKAKDISDDRRDSEYPVRLVVIDSLTAHFRSEFTGRGELANRQQKLNRHMHDLLQLANATNAVALVTNQVQSNPDAYFGDPTKPIGGNIIGHTSNFRAYLRKSKDSKRVFNLVDAPNLEDAEGVFSVTNDGVVPEGGR